MLGLHSELFPLQSVNAKVNIECSHSILFFPIYDGKDEVLYEVDLDNNSTFIKMKLKKIIKKK